MVTRSLHSLFAALVALAAAAVPASAQGVSLKEDACLLFGAADGCTKPATVDWEKLRDATPEWKTIRSDGVTKDSARYSLLISEMKKRIRKHCKTAAQDQGNDCVVRSGDISDARGLTVGDLTSRVVKLLESEVGDS